VKSINVSDHELPSAEKRLKKLLEEVKEGG